jgi:DNA-binding Xre family transcriptional regulator
MVKSNLKKILDERQLSIRQVAKDINHRPESVRQLYNDELERYPRELLTKLCTYLDVTPGEILIFEKKGGVNPD